MDNRSARPRAKNLMFAVLAVGAAALASGNLAKGDDDPPAPGEGAATATADEGTQRAAEPREEERSAGKDPGSAETQAAAAEPSVPTVEIKDAGDAQIVCRSYRRLGTRIRKSVCATAAEWEARAAQDAKDVDTFARQAREAASIPPPADVTPGRTPL